LVAGLPPEVLVQLLAAPVLLEAGVLVAELPPGPVLVVRQDLLVPQPEVRVGGRSIHLQRPTIPLLEVDCVRVSETHSPRTSMKARRRPMLPRLESASVRGRNLRSQSRSEVVLLVDSQKEFVKQGGELREQVLKRLVSQPGRHSLIRCALKKLPMRNRRQHTKPTQDF
jgi:hypothetical protein